MNIELYGKANCSYCKLAKRALEQKDLPFTYKLAESPEVVQHLVENVSSSIKSVPVVVIDGQYIGGYEELQSYLRENLHQEVGGEYKTILNG